MKKGNPYKLDGQNHVESTLLNQLPVLGWRGIYLLSWKRRVTAFWDKREEVTV